MGLLKRFRNRYLPTEEDAEVRELYHDMEIFEVQQWVNNLLYIIGTGDGYQWDEDLQDYFIPPDHIESFDRLTDTQKSYAFYMVCGALEGVLHDSEPED